MPVALLTAEAIADAILHGDSHTEEYGIAQLEEQMSCQDFDMALGVFHLVRSRNRDAAWNLAGVIELALRYTVWELLMRCSFIVPDDETRELLVNDAWEVFAKDFRRKPWHYGHSSDVHLRASAALRTSVAKLLVPASSPPASTQA